MCVKFLKKINAKKSIIVAVSLLLFTFGSYASLDKSQAVKNGFIDYGVLFSESKQGKKIIQDLKDKYEPLHLDLKNRNEKLTKAEQKLQVDKPSLPIQEFQRQTVVIKQGYELLQIDEQLFQDSRMRDEENARQKMHKEIDIAVKVVAESLGLDIVFERSIALYVSKKIDVTREVLQELNKG